MSKRNYNITRNKGEWYNAKVTDSYGNKYQNYFEFAHEANEWIYYVWENEDKFNWNKENSQELLSKAIAECVQIDIDRGVEPVLD
tara:strand:- start:612 stop:866 length:255 start_codon:yes stop_codon:yes gene_type:complete